MLSTRWKYSDGVGVGAGIAWCWCLLNADTPDVMVWYDMICWCWCWCSWIGMNEASMMSEWSWCIIIALAQGPVALQVVPMQSVSYVKGIELSLCVYSQSLNLYAAKCDQRPCIRYFQFFSHERTFLHKLCSFNPLSNLFFICNILATRKCLVKPTLVVWVSQGILLPKVQ